MDERERFAGARCVVTGGAGFIGRHLVERLLCAGVERVRVLDRAEMIAKWPRRLCGGALELAAVDLAEARGLERQLAGFDYLFHLAAEKHARASSDPQRAFAVNVLAMERLLSAAAKAGVRKVVFSSSLAAHGRVAGPALREDEVPQPESVYGISKLAGEHLLRRAAREHGLPGTSLRLFFIYGPWQDVTSPAPTFIPKTFTRILRGEPPIVCGSGAQVLDYLYVDDAVDALLRAVDPAVDGALLNIGSGTARTIAELAGAMLSVAGSRLPVERIAADGTDGTRRVADNALARARLGWAPRTSLEQGLARTFEHIQAELRI